MKYEQPLVDKVFAVLFPPEDSFREEQETAFVKECFEIWVLNCGYVPFNPEDILLSKKTRKAAFHLLDYVTDAGEREKLSRIKRLYKQTEDINTAMEMFLR